MLSAAWREAGRMRRADRLFQIIQVLRRTRKPVTADAIALELETSKRTIYRDIADLMAQRAPIRGEAGVGYVLDDGFDMPPLMLTPDEVEAAVLGAQLVARQGDLALARAAEDLVAKIRTVVPERQRPQDPHELPRRAGATERAHHLAVRGRLPRERAAADRLVRTQAGLPQLPH